MKYENWADFSTVSLSENAFIDQWLHPTIKESNIIVIYGAGINGIYTLQLLRKHGKEPVAFCDNNSLIIGNEISNVPIIGINDLIKYNHEIVIIITPRYYSVEIEKELMKLGFVNVFLHPSIISDHFGLKGYCMEHEAKQAIIDNSISIIDTVRNCLADEQSMTVFDSVKQLWLYGNFRSMLSVVTNEDYYPSDIIMLNDNEVYVDCGSYTGDTLLEFIRRTNGSYREIYAFEADELHHEIAKKTIQNKGYENINFHNIGIYSKKDILNFDNTSGLSNRITLSGNSRICVDKLDNLLKDRIYPITYIKMDIEGAECDGLAGAHNIILEDKPKLAICAYHKFCDIWEIPYYILSNFIGYKIYMRQNSVLSDTICYAVYDN